MGISSITINTLSLSANDSTENATDVSPCYLFETNEELAQCIQELQCVYFSHATEEMVDHMFQEHVGREKLMRARNQNPTISCRWVTK